MPSFLPLRGVRFSPRSTTPERGICPPYDVIGEEAHRALLAHDPHNAVRWILGEDPRRPLGDRAEYERRGAQFRGWIAEGILEQEREPCLYRYEVSLRRGPLAGSRWVGLIGWLDASRWGGGTGALPHEEVRAKVVSDRRELLAASGVDTGAVQICIDDRSGEFGGRLARAGAERLYAGVGWDGDEHRLDRIAARSEIDGLVGLLARHTAVVADGHHRYTSLMEYGQQLRARGGRHADYRPRAVSAVGDLFQPGLRILPTHRLLIFRGAAPGEERAAAERLARALDDRGGDRWSITLADGAALEVASEDRPGRPTLTRRLNEAVAALPVPPEIETFHDLEAARRRLASERGPALLCQLPPLSKEEFWRRSTAGEVFPPKTTYFLPKISTGLIAAPLDEEPA